MSSAADKMSAKYKNLMSDFINRKLSGPEFEASYIALFLNDQDQVLSPQFDLLDRLFADVDDYTAEPELRERVGGMDDEELRACTREVYRKLYET